MSITLKLSGNSSALNATYFPNIVFPCDYELALLSFHTWYSIANVNETNNVFYYIQKDHVEIPPGAYEIEDIEEFLNQKLNEKHGNS